MEKLNQITKIQRDSSDNQNPEKSSSALQQSILEQVSQFNVSKFRFNS
jgi:hypothetical protein